MEQFCKHCGKPISDSLQFCQHCGEKIERNTETPKNQAVPAQKKEPKKYTKKQKIIFSVVAAVVVLFGAFYMWGNSYYSEAATAERFMEALIEEDADTVQNVTVLNGNTISKAEAQALITLAKEEASAINLQSTNVDDFLNWNDLFRVVENGNALLIFPKYVFSLVPQYADVELPFEDIEVTFNEEEMPVADTYENGTVFGPMAPGKYNVHSSYSGEFTEAESDSTLVLANMYGDYVFHTINLEAEFVTFDLYNSNNSFIESAAMEVNENMVPLDENFRLESFGPLNLDGSVTVTPVIETNWGEVRLDSIEVSQSYYDVSVNKISEDLQTSLSDTILAYGEEYVEAHAANDASIFTTTTSDLREVFADNYECNENYGIFFTGQLDKIEIDYSGLYFNNENELEVPADFYFTAATYYEDEDAELEERIDEVVLVMHYNEDEEKWFINEASPYRYYSDFNATETLEGSQELIQSSLTDTAPAAKEDDDSDDGDEANQDIYVDIEEVTLNYISQLVEAINAGDYSLVEDYIKDGSALHSMQEDLVDRLSSEGMTQEVVSASVSSIEEDGDAWKVVTDETIKLTYESGTEETEDYVWTYTVEEDGDGFALTNIE